MAGIGPGKEDSRPGRRLDALGALLLAASSLTIVAALLKSGVRVTAEDGYYYFKIAQQMAHGAGSTFDGLHPTNGYHPLWLLCLTPIFRFIPDPNMALTAGILLQGVFMAAGVVLLYITARRTIGRSAASLSTLLWLGLAYPLCLSGLEFSLHALGVLAIACLYVGAFGKEMPRRPAPYLALGLIVSLAFLARLDTLLLAGILGLFLVCRERRAGWTRGSRTRLLAFGLPILATCLLYAGVNAWLFGHPLPISGVVKREWSLTLLAQDPLYRSHGWLTAKGALLLQPLRRLREQWPLAAGAFLVPGLSLAAAGNRRSLRWGRLWRAWQPYGPFALFSALQLLSTVLIYHGDLSFKPWYYVAQPWLAALLVGIIFDRGAGWLIRWREASWLPGALLLLIWSVIPLAIGISVKQRVQRARLIRDPLYDAALWARGHLPPDAVIGSWNAGTIGFISGRRVVDLDGLVNSWDYWQAGRFDLCRYWQQNRIAYLVDAFENGQALSRVPTYSAYAPCAGRLERVWSSDRYGVSWHMEAYRIPLRDERK